MDRNLFCQAVPENLLDLPPPFLVSNGEDFFSPLSFNIINTWAVLKRSKPA